MGEEKFSSSEQPPYRLLSDLWRNVFESKDFFKTAREGTRIAALQNYLEQADFDEEKVLARTPVALEELSAAAEIAETAPMTELRRAYETINTSRDHYLSFALRRQRHRLHEERHYWDGQGLDGRKDRVIYQNVRIAARLAKESHSRFKRVLTYVLDPVYYYWLKDGKAALATLQEEEQILIEECAIRDRVRTALKRTILRLEELPSYEKRRREKKKHPWKTEGQGTGKQEKNGGCRGAENGLKPHEGSPEDTEAKTRNGAEGFDAYRMSIVKLQQAIEIAGRTGGTLRLLRQENDQIHRRFQRPWEELLETLGFHGRIDWLTYEQIARSPIRDIPLVVPVRMHAHLTTVRSWKEGQQNVFVIDISKPNLLLNYLKING